MSTRWRVDTIRPPVNVTAPGRALTGWFCGPIFGVRRCRRFTVPGDDSPAGAFPPGHLRREYFGRGHRRRRRSAAVPVASGRYRSPSAAGGRPARSGRGRRPHAAIIRWRVNAGSGPADAPRLSAGRRPASGLRGSAFLEAAKVRQAMQGVALRDPLLRAATSFLDLFPAGAGSPNSAGRSVRSVTSAPTMSRGESSPVAENSGASGSPTSDSCRGDAREREILQVQSRSRFVLAAAEDVRFQPRRASARPCQYSV